MQSSFTSINIKIKHNKTDQIQVILMIPSNDTIFRQKLHFESLHNCPKMNLNIFYRLCNPVCKQTKITKQQDYIQNRSRKDRDQQKTNGIDSVMTEE